MKMKTNLSLILGGRRITQTALAEQAGLTKQAIGPIYHDRWKAISRETIEKICTALEIDICELFELVEDSNGVKK